MPKITINEVDLTKASLQPSATDIAFVPGFTCLSSFPNQPTLCSNISDFEKNFGTYPAITGMYRRYVYSKDQKNDQDEVVAHAGDSCGYKKYRVKSNTEFEKNFYSYIVKNTYYKAGIPALYSRGSLSNVTQVVLAVPDSQTESSIDGWLTACGLQIDTVDMPETDEVKTSYFDFEYDMSYVYAKELIRAGIPVIYAVCKDLTPVSEETSENQTISTSLVAEEDTATITSSTVGTSYTLSVAPVANVISVKVNDVDITVVDEAPSSGECSINKETGVITFGTALVEEDELEVLYNVYNMVNTYTLSHSPVQSVVFVKVNGVELTSASSTPSAGEYAINKETGVITFGTSLTNGDELSVKYMAVLTKTEYTDILGYVGSYFSGLNDEEDNILDRGEYSIKYVTSGAYPSIVFYKSGEDEYGIENGAFSGNLLSVSGIRGDCVSLIDMGDSTLYESSTSEDKVRKYEQEQMLDPSYLWNAVVSDNFLAECPNYTEYGALFAPWALYSTQSTYYVASTTGRTELPQLSSVILPPSFGYLITLAKSITVNNNWVAVAGVARGQVPTIQGLYTASRLSNALANRYQPRNGKTSINPITDIKPYGLTIWGNRTMKNNLTTSNGGDDGLTATSFLNIRNMVSDVKKTAYVAAKNLLFEQNSDILWVNFLSKVTPLLNRLMSGQGLSDYKVIQVPTDEKAKMKATIKLFPIYAVEDFEITIELSDEDVSVIG